MQNKTLGGWLLGTLAGAIIFYLGGSEDVAGIIILINWGFVIAASIRLSKE